MLWFHLFQIFVSISWFWKPGDNMCSPSLLGIPLLPPSTQPKPQVPSGFPSLAQLWNLTKPVNWTSTWTWLADNSHDGSNLIPTSWSLPSSLLLTDGQRLQRNWESQRQWLHQLVPKAYVSDEPTSPPALSFLSPLPSASSVTVRTFFLAAVPQWLPFHLILPGGLLELPGSGSHTACL